MQTYDWGYLVGPLAVLAAILGASSGRAADVEALETVPGWGTVLDPVGDCRFQHMAEHFLITVPGTYHDLWPIKGQVNAPLVLQEITGDVALEVLVEAVTPAEAESVLPMMTSTASFHAGSLVLWQDARNFVRLDRTDMHNRGRRIISCYLHVFQQGERTAEVSQIVPDRPTSLRLVRQGDRLSSAYSQNGGRTWTALPDQTIQLANKVKAGVSALNNTRHETTVRFAHLKCQRGTSK